MAVGLLATPEVEESGEGEFLVEEVQSPDTSKLAAGIGTGVVVALEELLVEIGDGSGDPLFVKNICFFKNYFVLLP